MVQENWSDQIQRSLRYTNYPTGTKHPGGQKLTEAIAEQARLDGKSIPVDSADAMKDYFERYYGDSGADLGKTLVDQRDDRSLKFATLADEFEMISDRTREVLVQEDDDAKAAIGDLRQAGFLDKDMRRK